jgi:hypothetical protein
LGLLETGTGGRGESAETGASTRGTSGRHRGEVLMGIITGFCRVGGDLGRGDLVISGITMGRVVGMGGGILKGRAGREVHRLSVQ